MGLASSILFNKIKKPFEKQGIIIKEFIFVDFKNNLFSIDGCEGKKITADLSEYKSILDDVVSLYVSKTRVVLEKANGEKIEQ